MESNEIIREQILEVVENQLRANDPPETKQTYDRLVDLGYNDSDAKKLISQCVLVEIFDAYKHGKTFDEKRFVQNLNNLPQEPFDEEE